jgi:hypothetical protein
VLLRGTRARSSCNRSRTARTDRDRRYECRRDTARSDTAAPSRGSRERTRVLASATMLVRVHRSVWRLAVAARIHQPVRAAIPRAPVQRLAAAAPAVASTATGWSNTQRTPTSTRSEPIPSRIQRYTAFARSIDACSDHARWHHGYLDTRFAGNRRCCSRYWPGVMPVQRLNARWNALCSE